MPRRRRPLGTPVQYPEGHPYNDPRKRTADAMGMLDALSGGYAPERGSSRDIENRVREFVGFMWAVEGKELSNEEIVRYRLGLMRDG